MQQCIDSLLAKLEEQEVIVDIKQEVVDVKESSVKEEKQPDTPMKSAQEIMDALMRETMNKQPEVMDTDSDVSNVAVDAKNVVKIEVESPEKNDAEKCVKDEDKAEAKENGSPKEEERSARVISSNYNIQGFFHSRQVYNLREYLLQKQSISHLVNAYSTGR